VSPTCVASLSCCWPRRPSYRAASPHWLMCEFLTAVHHRLPVKVVIFPLEAEAAALAPFREAIGTLPRSRAPAAARDFLRRCQASSRQRIQNAFAGNGPAIDAIVAPDDLATFPVSIWNSRSFGSGQGQGSGSRRYRRLSLATC
jgi:hypothetical protein